MLPKIAQTIFTLTLPIIKQTIRYRQFTVREEKILLMAQSSGQSGDMAAAFMQLINNCSLDPLDVENLSVVDVEYFFLNLRAKSVSNITAIVFKGKDGKDINVDLNLDELTTYIPEQSKTVVLSEEQGIGVTLKYPTYGMLKDLGELGMSADSNTDPETVVKIFRLILDSIFDKDNVYPTSESSREEVDEFILSLNGEQVAKLRLFLEDQPYVFIDVTYKDGEEDISYRVKGMESFFG